jgi:hypothetical protein
MSRLAAVAALASLVLTTAVHAQSTAAPHPLVGAWRVAEIAEANRPPVTAPQPGLYIFTREHYSFMRINGAQPLPAYPSNDKATDAEKVAVFNALFLQSGTYTLKDNVLATKALVAKSAYVMAAAGNQFDIAITGDTLVLTQKPNGSTLKLVRVE